jgi:hypothetical protein
MRLVAYMVLAAVAVTVLFVVLDGTALWVGLAAVCLAVGVAGRWVFGPRRTA